jgi:tRNA (guanine-N7-)-methyltransferase
MGQSLLAMAAANSNMNFIGVEVHRPGIGNLLAIAHEKGLTNIRVFSGDALSFMSNCLPDVSINGVLLFFPDPWPKKRHHKRRIVQPAFLDLVARKLVSGGYFHTATDVMGYADHMIQVAKSHPHFHNQVGLDWPAIIERPKTKFESRGEDLGHTITDLVFIKE